MEPSQVSAVANLTAVGFADFPEATASVLAMLEEQLPGTAVIVGQFDEQTMVYRVLDTAGVETFGLERGGEMPLAETVCFQMTVHTDGAMVCNDAATHPLYGDLPGRSGLGFGSYVGVGMKGSTGERFGAVCAIAEEPGRFGEADLQLLTVVARLLAYELERQMQMRSLEELTRELAELARTDDLTGLANRAAFNAALTREWQLARRDDVESLVGMADLDRFKPLNDRFGHLAGDEALRLFAEALQEAGRTTDVFARVGGDEFAIILVRCRTCAGESFERRVNELLAARLADRPYTFGVSMGWASLGDAESPDAALGDADRAMFEAKRARRTTSA